MQQELSNEYQHDKVLMVLKKSLHPCALGKRSHSIGRVKGLEILYNSKSSEIGEDDSCHSCLVAILKHCNLRKALKIVNK